MVADWFHEEVVVVVILKRQQRKCPDHTIYWVYIQSGSGRNAQVSLLERDFKLDDVMLWIRGCLGLCDTFQDVRAACYVSAVGSILAHSGPSAEMETFRPHVSVLVLPGRGVIPANYPSWAHWSKDKVTGPAWRGLSLSFPRSTPSTPAVAAGLGSPLLLGRHFAHWQLAPSVWASAFQYPVWIHSSAQT